MSEPAVSFFAGRDGIRLAYRELGQGRPLILLHGLMGDGTLWLRHGQAEAFVRCGFRVILPDLRGHGSSDKPTGRDGYPDDVLADDAFALLEHLGLAGGAGADAGAGGGAGSSGGYDLAGYSLGARVVVRALVRGAAPRRAVVGGQGLKQVLGFGGGTGRMLQRIASATEPFEAGSPEAQIAAWLAAKGEDPGALVRLVDSVMATPVEELAGVRVPTLVVMGSEDERRESVDALVEALPEAIKVMVPGDHGAASFAPELVAAMVDFLTAA